MDEEKDFRVGDDVDIRAMVIAVGEPSAVSIRVEAKDRNFSYAFNAPKAATRLVKRYRRPPAVGQRARVMETHTDHGDTGVVLAVAGAFAWFKCDQTTAPRNIRLQHLERIDA